MAISNSGARPTWQRSQFFRFFASLKLAVILLAVILLTITGTSLHGQTRSRSEETLEWWNHIGSRLIAMAKDFPEDKYDFKVQKDQRTLQKICCM